MYRLRFITLLILLVLLYIIIIKYTNVPEYLFIGYMSGLMTDKILDHFNLGDGSQKRKRFKDK